MNPPNVLTPAVFADRAKALACGTDLRVEILDEHRIAELGMGLLLRHREWILPNHRGSSSCGTSPRVLPRASHWRWWGKGFASETAASHQARGGHGSHEVGHGRRRGRDCRDARRVAAARSPPSHRHRARDREHARRTRRQAGRHPAERSGKTVEVLNTDAEGRLVLGDGLWYAQQLGATHLVDVATLTGACVVALGRWASGLFGRPDAWVDAVRRAADRAGERAWPLPVDDDYFDQLKSEWADMSNTGGRPAGAITAAVFIKQFAGDLPWAHLDIAGTVWIDEPKPWQSKGATGTAVRTLVELALSQPHWPISVAAKQSA